MIEIRKAELTDEIVHLLTDFSAAWEQENSCYGYRKNERSDMEGNHVFLAYDGEKAVGYLFGHFCTAEKTTSVMPENTTYFEVEELYVMPTYRRMGIGQQLYRFSADAVRGDAEYILLSTATKNWRAILHFYIEELGMEFWNARLFQKLK